MKKLLLILTLAFTINANSQDDKTVTLVVSGQGKTQEEAKQNALRSAIEQAFGTFISSKTEILNDNLVKDEIVSVTNGNIQKFEVLSEVQIPNGVYATSLKAIVSVSKLTSFCENKGVEVEFKGSLLAANVKQQILNEQNEIESIKNITNTCKTILDQSCDFEILSAEPKQYNNDNTQWVVPITINVKFNRNIKQFNKYLVNSINRLSMSLEEVNQYKLLGKQTYKLAIWDDNIGGKTNNIDTLKSLSKSNPNLIYIIKSMGSPIFKSDNIELLIKKFKKLKKEGDGMYSYDIQFYDKSIQPNFHFRSLSTIQAIIDLILYTKHSILNFKVSNDKHVIGCDNLISQKSYGFKLIKSELTPILYSRKILNHGWSLLSKPGSILYSDPYNIEQGFNPDIVTPYKNLDRYLDEFCYNGELFKDVFNYKYSFISQINSDILPRTREDKNLCTNSSFKAVISLFDYKSSYKSIVSLYFEEILSLSDLEKIKGYKISSIKK